MTDLIVGGNAFNATMTGDIGEQGTCTTCAYTEGRSFVALLTSTADTHRLFQLLDCRYVFQAPEWLLQARPNLSQRSVR